MSTPTRKLPFRKNMGYGGEKRCVICTGFLPYHHGFCDGSVGTVINETMLQEAERIQLRSGHLVRSLTGELYACTGCGHIKCSCRPEEPQPVIGVDYARGPDVTAITMATKDGSVLNFEDRMVHADARQPEWKQEGARESHYVCTHRTDGNPENGSSQGCRSLASWWRGEDDLDCLGRCDKHAPAARKEDPSTPTDRPGWARTRSGAGGWQWQHASGFLVWLPPDVTREASWCRGRAHSAEVFGTTLDHAFATAERAIEETGWRPTTFRASMADADIYQLRGESGGVVGKFVQIGNPHKHHWAWRADPANRWMPAESMVEAFARAEMY